MYVTVATAVDDDDDDAVANAAATASTMALADAAVTMTADVRLLRMLRHQQRNSLLRRAAGLKGHQTTFNPLTRAHDGI